jgi:molybdopterin-binding protein
LSSPNNIAIIGKLDGGPEVVSAISIASVQRLKLAADSKVTIVIKATEVMLATKLPQCAY